jgi:RNA polymerase sigma factor (sigma-70 family)
MNPRAEPGRDPEDALAFCARLRPRLVGTLTLSCGSAAIAEELTQETLARVWLNWPRVSRLDAPEAWAYRVATNLARSSFRRRSAERRARARYESRAERFHRDPDAAEALVVRQALAALPPRQRTALAWRHYAGLTVEQTAAAMGCAPGTVRALTSQGLAALRRRPEFRAVEEVPDAR